MSGAGILTEFGVNGAPDISVQRGTIIDLAPGQVGLGQGRLDKIFGVGPGSARGRPLTSSSPSTCSPAGPAIRAAVLDADTDEVLGPTGTRESVVI